MRYDILTSAILVKGLVCRARWHCYQELLQKHARFLVSGDSDMVRHAAILLEWYFCYVFALPPSLLQEAPDAPKREHRH